MIKPPSLYNKYVLTTDILDKLCTDTQKNSLNDCKKNIIFNKGDFLFKEGEELKGMIGIEKGQVKLFREIGKKQYIIRIVNSGEVLGYRSIIAEAEATVSALAMNKVEATIVPSSKLKEVIGNNPEVSEQLMKMLAQEAKKSNIKMASLAYKPVRSRIAEALIELHQFNKSQGDLNIGLIDISRENLAGLVGTVRETVTRTLNEFNDLDVIDMEKRKIIIKDEDKLRSIALED